MIKENRTTQLRCNAIWNTTRRNILKTVSQYYAYKAGKKKRVLTSQFVRKVFTAVDTYTNIFRQEN